ncbi:MAG: histidine phosphatase family protein [Crocinitomicaceae bacterium]|nr:histidine phosphatase family protein [Crocinitomicaceae bacterium]
MLNLYLLRHGKAANPEKYDSDYERPLNKKGIVQINQIGYKLQTQGNQIDQLIFSSALRTKETAQIANHYLGINNILYSKELYLARQEDIQNYIRKNAESSSLLYVGHNFGISDFASYLAGEMYALSTGMLIHFQFECDSWDEITQGSGTVIEAFPPNIYLP